MAPLSLIGLKGRLAHVEHLHGQVLLLPLGVPTERPELVQRSLRSYVGR